MYKIFIVEDDEFVAEIYKQKIAAEGYLVKVATEGEGAFEKLQAFNPDLLLLDLHLPGLSGVDLLKMLRANPQFKELPILAFSGTESEDILDEAIRFGATRVLSKSEFTPNQIVARITELLAVFAPPRKEEIVTQSIAEWQPPAGRVLVLDDDEMIMELVTDIVEEGDYVVVSATDGREAYRILNTDNNFVACIFDVNVPFIEGPDLIQYMKTEKRLMKIPILVMTSNESLGVQTKSFSAGAAIVILKPFTRVSLRTMFRTIVNEKING